MPKTKDPMLLLLGEMRRIRNRITRLDTERDELARRFEEKKSNLEKMLEISPQLELISREEDKPEVGHNFA